MKKFTLTFIAICTLFIMNGISQKSKSVVALRSADVMPSYPGCEEDDKACTRKKVAEYVMKQVKLPQEAKEAEKGGVAVVNFVIEKNGSVSDVTLLKDPGHGMGKEAIRAVESMNKNKIKWSPGMEDGKKVRVQFTLPVKFDLNRAPKPAALSDAASSMDDPDVYEQVEEMPRFQGCEEATKEEAKRCTYNQLIGYMKLSMKYPAAAKAEKVEGQVVTSFIINEEGKVTKPTVLKGLNEECDKEALRLLKEMPVWTPGKEGGKAVKVKMTLPFQFKLGKDQ